MAESDVQLRRPSADNQTVSKADISLKERFFRYFQHEITGMFPFIFTRPFIIKQNHQKRTFANTIIVPDLQQEMGRLADTALVGGERADATDHCLAGIVRLSNEVKDAASYIPTYDQRVYAEVNVNPHSISIEHS